jgi:hypothetical protein
VSSQRAEEPIFIYSCSSAEAGGYYVYGPCGGIGIGGIVLIIFIVLLLTGRS